MPKPGTVVATEECGAPWQNQQMVLKPFTIPPSPGISLQVPVRLLHTSGETLPAAASPARVLSGALQGNVS